MDEGAAEVDHGGEKNSAGATSSEKQSKEGVWDVLQPVAHIKEGGEKFSPTMKDLAGTLVVVRNRARR